MPEQASLFVLVVDSQLFKAERGDISLSCLWGACVRVNSNLPQFTYSLRVGQGGLEGNPSPGTQIIQTWSGRRVCTSTWANHQLT